MEPTPEQRAKDVLKLLDTPEARERYQKALEKWDKRLKPLIDANRKSEQFTADDFNIRIGPCREREP